MKCRVLKMVCVTVFTGMFLTGFSQKNYYVVVGAFSTNGDARELTTQLPVTNADTTYTFYNDDNLVQLYVLKTNNEAVAAKKATLLQKGIEQQHEGNYQSVIVNNHPEGRSITFQNNLERIAPEDLTSDAASSGSSSSMAGLAVGAPEKANIKRFRFVIADSKGVELQGKIHAVDLETGKDLGSFSTQTYSEITNPGMNNNIAMICGIFGYKMEEKNFNYINPSLIEGAYMDSKGTWIIPYELKRLEKGDVSVMYNVSFHKNANVMLPASKKDLDELVWMMKENPDYAITIHSHCNGNAKRTITALGSNYNYFETQGTSDFDGTAKELTKLRAHAVRQYLMENGIDEKRIKTFAWGGRLPLVDATDLNAALNDRIEIEIRKD